MKQKSIIFLTVFFLIVIVFCTFGSADTPYRVLVLPFDIYSDKDLSFLQKGIEDMLSTRLTLKDKMMLIDREDTRRILNGVSGPIDEKTAVSLGSEISADYVAFGSLTVFGESISTDARFIDVRQKKPVVVFNEAGESHGDLIRHVDMFAGRISDTLFGRKPETPLQTPRAEATADIHAHPEKLWTGDVRVDEGDYVDGPDGTAKIASALWKSRRFKVAIKGLAIGDVDGDGNNETVFIENNKLFVYRYADGRFIRVREFEGQGFDNFIGVDVADINQNGVAEIFLANYANNKHLRSYVLEWQGQQFSKIAENTNWYYRVVRISDRGQHLFGQKRGVGEQELFRSGIYEMIWQGGQYVPMEKQPLPRAAKVHGFAYGNILNNGQEMAVVYSPSEHLRILDKGGKEEWKSVDPFGGGSVYLEFPDERHSREETDRVYLQQRIHAADLDADGKTEVVVVKNEDASGKLLTRTRIYKSGLVECLVWDNFGLYPKWRTRRISGHVSDVSVNDFDNDGKDEIVFSVVGKGGMLSYDKKSYIVSWEISP
jgi:TolB-like protein